MNCMSSFRDQEKQHSLKKDLKVNNLDIKVNILALGDEAGRREAHSSTGNNSGHLALNQGQATFSLWCFPNAQWWLGMTHLRDTVFLAETLETALSLLLKLQVDVQKESLSKKRHLYLGCLLAGETSTLLQTLICFFRAGLCSSYDTYSETIVCMVWRLLSVFRYNICSSFQDTTTTLFYNEGTWIDLLHTQFASKGMPQWKLMGCISLC